MIDRRISSRAVLFATVLFASTSLAAPPGSQYGPGNSGAAQNQLPDPQKNCVGAFVSTTAQANQGLDIPANNEPGEVVDNLSDLFSLGNAIGLWPAPQFEIFYETCEEYAPIP
jgi:hypothetical protein